MDNLDSERNFEYETNIKEDNLDVYENIETDKIEECNEIITNNENEITNIENNNYRSNNNNETANYESNDNIYNNEKNNNNEDKDDYVDEDDNEYDYFSDKDHFYDENNNLIEEYEEEEEVVTIVETNKIEDKNTNNLLSPRNNQNFIIDNNAKNVNNTNNIINNGYTNLKQDQKKKKGKLSNNIQSYNIILNGEKLKKINFIKSNIENEELSDIRKLIGSDYCFSFLDKGKLIEKKLENELTLSDISSHNKYNIREWDIQLKNIYVKRQIDNKDKGTICDFTFPTINLSENLCVKHLGKGSFGDVSLFKYLSVNIAKKTFFKQGRDDDMFKLELKHSIKIRNVRTPTIYGYVIDNCAKNGSRSKFQANSETNSILMEYFHGECLNKHLETLKIQDIKKPEVEIKYLILMLDLAKSIEFLHKKKIIHRDIKPENIIVVNEFNLKLLDFGISKQIKEAITGTYTEQKGTILYEPPENFPSLQTDLSKTNEDTRNKINTKFDVWSFGLIVSEVFSLEKPWNNCSYSILFKNLSSRKEFPIPEILKNSEIGHLIYDCTKINVNDRINISSVKSRLLNILMIKLSLFSKNYDLEKIYKGNKGIF